MKRNIKSIAAGLYLGVAAAVLVASPASAALIEQDLNTLNDKLITLDTDTSLQWLDVNATLGLTYDAAQTTAFVTSQGFRSATQSEVLSLFTSVGITVLPTTGGFLGSNFAGVQELLAKLGCTGNCTENDPFLQGTSDFDVFNPTRMGLPFVQANLTALSARMGYGGGDNIVGFSKATLSDPEVGSYLVRTATAISEPATLAILGLGLAGLGFARHRKLA